MSQSSSTRERVGVVIGPESFRLIMTTADLKVLWSFCFILTEFHMILAASEERIHVPPVGCIRVYKKAVMVDLHFFLYPFMKRVIDRFFLSLAQVAPNSWRYIVGFVCLCNMLDRRPMLGLF